jgi:hypothetical protein
MSNTPMKLLSEYLENALTFERLAAAETNAKLKASRRQKLTASRRKSGKAWPQPFSRQSRSGQHGSERKSLATGRVIDTTASMRPPD